MKKIAFLILFTLTLFTSCEKIIDDETLTNEDLFIGTWTIDKLYWVNSGENINHETVQCYGMVFTPAHFGYYTNDGGIHFTNHYWYEESLVRCENMTDNSFFFCDAHKDQLKNFVLKGEDARDYIKDNNKCFWDIQVFKTDWGTYNCRFKHVNEVNFSNGSLPFHAYSGSSYRTDTRSESVQCIGKTLENVRCRNITLNGNGYCYLHQSQYHPRTYITQIVMKDTTTNSNVMEYKVFNLHSKEDDDVMSGRYEITSVDGAHGYLQIGLNIGKYTIFYSKTN